MIDANDLLNAVTNDLVIEIMDENGSPLYDKSIDLKTNQECLWFRTICHGGDSHKLCYFTKSKDFYCYTNCGRMPFFEFIKKIRGFSDGEFYECLKYVGEKIGYNFKANRYGIGESREQKIRNNESKVIESIKRRKNLKFSAVENKIYDANILNYFDENTFYTGWINEGISIESMQKFGIRWYEYQKHIIIPHYDINGNLIGIRRRSLKPEDADNKYMPEYISGKSFEHSLGLNLYGIYENQDALRRYRRAIIVEGEKSVLLSDTYYGNESYTVATCGFNVSRQQMTLLSELGVRIVYLGFDKDYDILKEEEYKKDEQTYKNYLNYQKRLETLALRLNSLFNVYIIQDAHGYLGHKDSPFDRGKDMLELLLKDSTKLVKVRR